MIQLITIVTAIIVGIGSYYITKEPDNKVEQAAEAVIDYELGLPMGTIDLSKEKK